MTTTAQLLGIPQDPQAHNIDAGDLGLAPRSLEALVSPDHCGPPTWDCYSQKLNVVEEQINEIEVRSEAIPERQAE